jgi:hypothetical protein
MDQRAGRDFFKRFGVLGSLHYYCYQMRLSLLLVVISALVLVAPAFSKPIFGKLYKVQDMINPASGIQP